MSELPHACKVLPDEGPPVIAITGDLRVYPIVIVDWQPGVLSEPFELAGNGTYRLKVTPIPDPMPEWTTCPNCGCPGSLHHIVLADLDCKPLAGINLATFAHSMAVAIFGRYGVMLQTARRSDITLQGPLPSKFSRRNFAAAVVEWT
jgi:hypothetical protein